MISVQAEPEPRAGVWIPDREQLVEWLRTLPGPIHCFVGAGGGAVLVGADWDVDSVVEQVVKAERVALLTGDARAGNVGHGLAVIVSVGDDEHLQMFDVGPVDDVIETST